MPNSHPETGESLYLAWARNTTLTASKYPPVVRVELSSDDRRLALVFHCPEPICGPAQFLHQEASLLEVKDLNRIDKGQRCFSRFECKLIGDYGDVLSTWVSDKFDREEY